MVHTETVSTAVLTSASVLLLAVVASVRWHAQALVVGVAVSCRVTLAVDAGAAMLT